MDPGVSAAAVRVFSKVFADFAFLFGDAVTPEELPRREGPAWLASLPFAGQMRGSLAIGVPEPLAREIAANTLGVDPADPEVFSKAPDALKEVASLMGGHLATTFAGMTLSPPKLQTLDDAEWERLRTDAETLCFAMNDHPVLFRFEFKRGALST